MVLNTELSHDAEYIGDVQENRVGIDKSNLDFITTLLTSNLYSKPLESFFRETVANAYDSHVEAGTTEPILILIEDIPNKWGTFRISIRDYGTGVSPERFDQIYKNVGSSTKRQSNDYIGMFGIGRFSCLSCADVAHITSYYEGKKYSYLMYKNGGGINIDKLSEIEGEYKSGLEVSLEKSVTILSELDKALKGVCLFENLHVVYHGDESYLTNTVSSFNSRRVTNFKTFSKCSLLSTMGRYYRVGNVLYSGGSTLLHTEDGCIINMPIGSVDITPNREALQFTDFTNKAIETRVKEVQQEFTDIINSHIQQDHTLPQFCKEFIFDSYYNIEEQGEPLCISHDDVNVDLSLVKIDGEKIPQHLIRVIEMIRYNAVPKDLVHKNVNKSMYNRRGSIPTMKDLLLEQAYLVEKADRITKQVTTEWFIDELSHSATILIYEGLESFKQNLISYCKHDTYNRDVWADVPNCIDFIFKHLPIDVMSNDAVPQDYIEHYREGQRLKRKKAISSEIPVRAYEQYGYRLSNMSEIPSSGLVIYSTHTKDDSVLKGLASLSYYWNNVACVITVKAEYIKLLEKNRRFITAENFIYLKNSLLVKLTTAMMINRQFSKISATNDFSMERTPIYKEFKKKYVEAYECLVYANVGEVKQEILHYYESKGWYNKCDLQYFNLSEKEIEGYKEWKHLEERKYDIVKMMALKKYGRLQKIGLTP